MNNQTLKISDNRLVTDNITCLLVPLADRNLLLPSVSVAEMAPYQQPMAVYNPPAWLMGNFIWRNQQVPLLSFEQLSGDQAFPPAPNSRVAVLNNTGVSDNLPFIAILTQGIPRLVHVVPDSIVDAEEELQPYDLLRVYVENVPAVIPNINALEQVYLNYAG